MHMLVRLQTWNTYTRTINRKIKKCVRQSWIFFWCNTEMTEQSGSFDLPLTRFGGRFGKDTDTPYDEVINDDGISHMVEGGAH